MPDTITPEMIEEFGALGTQFEEIVQKARISAARTAHLRAEADSIGTAMLLEAHARQRNAATLPRTVGGRALPCRTLMRI